MYDLRRGACHDWAGWVLVFQTYGTSKQVIRPRQAGLWAGVEISGISGGQVCVGDGIRYLLAKLIFALHQPLPRRLWNVCVTDPPICATCDAVLFQTG